MKTKHPSEFNENHTPGAPPLLAPMRQLAYALGVVVRQAADLWGLSTRWMGRKITSRRSIPVPPSTFSPHQDKILNRFGTMETRIHDLERTLQEEFEPPPSSPTTPREKTVRYPSQKEPIRYTFLDAMPPDLLTELADADPSVRQSALRTIAGLDPVEASLMLAEALHNPRAEIRRAAAVASLSVGSTALLISLFQALNDRDLEVRFATKQAIEAIIAADINFDPRGNEDYRHKQIKALKQWWKERRLATLVSE